MEIQDGTSTSIAVGYYRKLGVGASSETEARSLISQSVDDGKIDWDDFSCEEIDLRLLDKKIAVHCEDPQKETIWYKSGHIFFPREEYGKNIMDGEKHRGHA
jgi:hypothetical protein